MAVLTVVALAGLLAVLYFFVLPRRTAGEPVRDATAMQSPVPPSGAAHPLAKHLEVSGVRITESGEGTVKIQFLVVNHSAADLPDMKMNLTLRAAGKAVFELPVALPSIGPYESRDMSANVKTDLKPYEIPDWQALRPEFRLATEP
jgi:hypothetical protein